MGFCPDIGRSPFRRATLSRASIGILPGKPLSRPAQAGVARHLRPGFLYTLGIRVWLPSRAARMNPETSASMKTLTVVAIKRGLLLFWSLWFSIVFAITVFDALQALGVVDRSWKFGSGILALISADTAMYGVPAGIHGAWRLGVIVCEGLVAAVFWRALHKFRGLGNADRHALAAAFGLALSLFAAFLVADRFFVNHLYEATHLRILVAQLVSLLGIYLLPE
jgi:hypothetical protein